MTLAVSRSLAVPLEYATDATAILGKRGSGKTNTAVVFVEEMLAAGLPVVVVDTVGVWWGLRSSADGNKAGLDVVIFGGEHGDVPLEEKSGVIISDAILDHGLSAVIDTSGLGKAASKRFLLALVTHIYQRKAKDRTPLHVVFDEADELAPQSTSGGGPEGPMLLSAMEDFVRRGRSRGLGCTLVTQRPAVLNKDVLTQVEILIAMRMTGPRDVAAIDEWVKLHAEPEVAQQVKRTLAALPTGTGWVWSPDFLDILEQVTFRPRQTFDSSATPKIGEVRQEPQARKEIDLGKLGEQIAATVEKAKESDPAELRRKIADLERQVKDGDRALIEALSHETPEPIVERVEVPVLSDDERQLLETIQSTLGGLAEMMPTYRAIVGRVTGATSAPALIGQLPPTPTSTATVQPPRALVTAVPTDGTALGKAARAILTVLATYGGRNQVQLALLTGYSSKGGGFRNSLGQLRSLGFIDGGKDLIRITDEGRSVLGDFEPLPTGQALIDHWLAQAGGAAHRAILTALIEAYPASLTQDEVADRTGYQSTGGGFRNALGKLRTLELIHGGRDALTAAATLGGARDA